MNKTIIASMIALVVATVIANEGGNREPNGGKMSERRERFLCSTGGRIVKPGTPNGKIRFVSSVKDVNAAVLERQYSQFKRAYPFDIGTVEGRAATVDTAASEKAKLGFALAVFIVDSPSSSPMLVAPEEGWAIVNHRVCITPERTAKQAVKAFAYIAGAANSSYGVSFLSSTRPQELDSIAVIDIPVDVAECIKKQLAIINVIPEVNVIYRQACSEGWAPPPTNKYQKAAWDKVHAPPEKPLKIEFDPATQKGKVTK